MSMMRRIVVRTLLAAGVLLLALLLVAARGQSEEGRRIFAGKGMCVACHGTEGRGTALGPDLTDAEWLHITPSIEAIDSLVRAGVAKPKKYPAPMPPRGGARLSDAEVRIVAAYVHGLGSPRWH